MPEVTAALARQTLTAVVLTRNEEARIARCLESVRWADEVIVVDGMSEDRTAEICRGFGARVIAHPFSGDFGAERNLGNEAATGDWILQLDADDAVSPELCRAIQTILRDGAPYAAYKFRRKNWFLGHEMRYGGWYHYYPHLFRRGRARFEGRVHHLLVTEGPLGRLEGALEHRPFDSLEQFIDRHNRYTSIEAQELWEQRGVIEPALFHAQLARRPLKLFWKTYVKKQGFREGWHGLIFSLLFAWVHAIKWAKYWELTEPRCAEGAQAAGGGDQDTPAPRPLSRLEGRPTLSVVLMTKNEEARLASCLDRVAGWADEIVVTDDFSTDRTVEIARRYTGNIVSAASEGNHDRQWNRGIERTRGEWILHIDADERVTPALRSAIDRALLSAGETSAFELMRKNVFLGRPMRHGGWYHRHLILFRRARARCVGAGIHVKLQVEGRIAPLDAEIEHYPFDSITQYVERQNRYTSVEARVQVDGEGPPPARQLAYQLLWRPAKVFSKSYRRNEGWREGTHGLVFALLAAFAHTLRWAKCWELTAGAHER